MIPATLSTKTIIRGDTFSELLVFYTLVDETETPIDLTIYDNIKMELRRGTNRRTMLIGTFTIGDGLTIGGDNNNELVINYPTTITDELSTGKYYRDIRFVSGSDVQTLLEGVIIVTENITEI